MQNPAGLMSAGFCILTLSARWSAAYGQSSMPLMVLGLAVMGFAELFIDPVAMSQIINTGQHPSDTRDLNAGDLRHRDRVDKQFGKAHHRQTQHHQRHGRLTIPGARWPASAWCWSSGCIIR